MKTNRIVTIAAAVAAAGGLAFGAASLASADQNGTSTSNPSATQSQNGESPQGQDQRGMGGQGMGNGNTDPSKPMRSDEKLLTGDTLAKVTAAVKVKEPNATIQRVETDSEGVYEAHMVRADGTHITVQVGADFAVTNVQEGGPNGSGMPGGMGYQPQQPQQGSTASPSVTG
ncbi:hypothetical protein N865_00305 [Intrasporangium oryzae NRRL B-24470]|uniref:PepSY domain-containing protein n=1 Tax=Intrasporangium oryzae NRRL B-24470 TaxID=1386089 RepID=W9GAB1_9MICO|nr:hypothetical protein [Intrasporangium oryzae]EWT02167.1 hypothetical protein N865_00305 [Intrasporangium oryzae NRRL B-24470]